MEPQKSCGMTKPSLFEYKTAYIAWVWLIFISLLFQGKEKLYDQWEDEIWQDVLVHLWQCAHLTLTAKIVEDWKLESWSPHPLRCNRSSWFCNLAIVTRVYITEPPHPMPATSYHTSIVLSPFTSTCQTQITPFPDMVLVFTCGWISHPLPQIYLRTVNLLFSCQPLEGI